MHENGKYSPKDLANTLEYQNLIDETNAVFDKTIVDNVVDGALLKNLQNDVFYFSALKTHAQLFEASRQLLDANQKIKPFKDFYQDVKKINEAYNRQYLEAEYQFAVASSQMANKWADFSDDYNLQYRTAGDERVRVSHDVLRDTTLPKADPFWDSFMPPNGWRCRCTVVEVLPEDYKESDSKEAISKGNAATTQIGKDGKNKLEIFRFNPGKDKVVFPPSHPYNKVAGANVVKDLSPKKINKNKLIPKGIDKYESELGTKIDKTIFSYLSKETVFTTVNIDKNIKSSGAYYYPAGNYVKIPIDERRKASKWYSSAVVYHEFGHAADFQNGFRKLGIVTDLMDKYRSEFSSKKNVKYKSIDQSLREIESKARKENNRDLLEKIGAASDTLMSLNSNFGSGHTKAYFKNAGMSEAEFLAHTFENKFAGNDVFEKVMPELYKDMIKLADDLKAKVK